MSESTAPEVTSTLTGHEKPSGMGLLGKALVGVFLAGIVTAECVTVYLFLPGEAETAALAAGTSSTDQNTSTSQNAFPNPTDPIAPDVTVPQVEVDLGEFTITAYQPISNTTLRIDFHLYGTVATEDQQAFQEALQTNIHRFRDQVIVIVRSAELTDLTDAGLGLIKRKILEKTNAMFGKRYLKAVIFSDFSFVEQ